MKKKSISHPAKNPSQCSEFPSPKFDLTAWIIKDEFTLREAAYLWYGVGPNTKEIPDEVMVKIEAMRKVLEGAFGSEATRSGFLAGQKITRHSDPIRHNYLVIEQFKINRERLKTCAERIGERPLFFFPEDSAPIQKEDSLRHSPDYRSINKGGKVYTLTSMQAQVIQMFWEAQEAGTPDLGQDYIIPELNGETSTMRLRDYFRTNLEAWRALVEPGNRKGTFRLKK